MKYWAFLSYSHTDRKWGDWLHKSLETYRVPRRLVGKESRDGKIPERLFPIFRDREELPVSADLGSNINEALKESRYLIVICSPRSAQSRWVGEEIKTFKQLGREERILALIVDGEPNASDGKPGFKVEDECFHEAMRYRMVDGEPTEIRSEPIAADAREGKDGRTNAKLKLLAGLLGVNYDDLKQREQERRLRRARRLVAAAVALIAVFAVLSVALFFKEREATHARTAAVEAEERTILRASKADADIGLQLARRRDEAGAFAHAVRSLELNPDNTIASLLAYRLLGDGPLTLPMHLLTHNSTVRAVAFSQDGSLLATGCDDGSVTVLDLKSGEKFVLAEKPLASVEKLAFSPRGGAIAIATGSEAREEPAIRVWEFRSRKSPVLVSGHFTWGILELAWPLDDRIVAYSGRDWGSGNQITQVFGGTYDETLDDILERTLEGKPDGWKLIFGFADSYAFEDVSKDNQSSPAPSANLSSKLVKCERFQTWVSEEPALLVVHDQVKRQLLWFDLKDVPDRHRPLFAVNTGENDIVDVAEQSGVAIIGGNFTDKFRWRRGARPNDKSPLRWADPLMHSQGNVSIARGTLIDRISADGERLLGLQGSKAVILERRTGERVAALEMQQADPYDLLAWSANGGTLFVRDQPNRVVVVTDEFADNASTTYARADARVFGSCVALPAKVGGAALDQGDNWLTIWSDDKNVRIWSRPALRNKPQCLSGDLPESEPESTNSDSSHPDEDENSPYWLQYGKDGQKEVCRRIDPNAKQSVCTPLQKVDEGHEVVGAEDDITGHSFSPDGLRVAVSYGSWSTRPDNNEPSVAALFDTRTGRIIGAPLRHDDDVFSPCYAPNGKWFLTVSDDRTLRRWDGITAAPLGEPLRLPKPRRFAQISPDNRLVVTGAGDVIDANRWTVIKNLEPEPVSFRHAFFSDDSQWVATVSTEWRPNDDSPYLLELTQWDLQNAVQISQSIEVPVAAGREATSGRYVVRWRDQGSSIEIGRHLIWRRNFPCSARELLPLLRACRPLILSETGEQVINDDCSLDRLSLKGLFPHGPTKENSCAYDYAERVLKRSTGQAQPRKRENGNEKESDQ